MTNSGPVTLAGVQLRDDLRLSFPAPVTLSVPDPPLVSGALTKGNPLFGLEDTALLSGTESLDPGESATVRFAVLIELNGAAGPFVNQVIGSAFDPDGEPVSDESDQPAEVDIPGCIEGSLFLDLNHNRIRDEADLPASDWDVFIFDAEGTQVGGPLIIASDGHFGSSSLVPGEYEVRVINTESRAVWNREAVTVQREQCEELQVLLDPQGVVYDSERREVIPGTALSLLRADGEPLSEQCLLPGQQGQLTDSYGRYRFDVQFGAAADCPEEVTQYRISIEDAPEEFIAAPSSRIPPQEGALDTRACATEAGLPCILQQQNDPPQADSGTDYHLAFVLRPGGGGFANNHIPLDPRLPPPPPPPIQCAEVDVVHVANRARATIGDIVGYRSVLENRSNLPVSHVQLEVIPPPGLNFLEDSFEVARFGIDGQQLVAGITLEGGREQPVEIGDLAPGESVEVRHAVRISPSASPGTKVSSVSVRTDCAGDAAAATASIVVDADPMLQKTTVIGKVFHDLNENGVQDGEEPGIPGVRLATLDGLVIETDSHGRYHLADVDTGRPDRGGNFMIKLDALSLPENRDASRVLRQVVRLTPGLMTRVNFPVRTAEPPGPVNWVSLPMRTAALPSILSSLMEQPTNRRTVLKAAGLAAALPVTSTDEILASENRTDPLRFEPKLDVLALDEVSHGHSGQDVRVRFAVFSNYHRFISRYELAVYDVTDPLRARRIEQVRPVEVDLVRSDVPTDLPDDDDQKLRLRSFLKGTITETLRQIPDPGAELFIVKMEFPLPVRARRLAYRLIAYGHCDPAALDRHDRTYLRLIDVVEQAAESPGRTRSAEEILGHSSLALQNIVVHGQRNLRVGDVRPPRSKPQVLEEIQPVPPPGPGRIAGKSLQATYGLTEETGRPEGANRQIELTDEETWAVFDHEGLPEGQSGFIQFDPERIVLVDEGDYEDVDNATGVHEVTLVCGCSRVSAETIVDRASNSLSLRLTNYGDFSEHPLVSFGHADPQGSPGAVSRDRAGWNSGRLEKVPTGTMIPGATQEIFLGSFSSGEMLSEDDWGTVTVQLSVADDQGNAPAFELTRNKRVGEFAPDIQAMCENVVARPHTTTQENRIASMIVKDRNPVAAQTALFAMGLINLTAGRNDVSGNLEAVSDDDHYDETVFVDGRVAGYLKGKIRGRYLITAQLDTTEDALGNLGNNLNRKDSARIFRQLDPDRYYPIYGDDSTTISDVDTQGAMYLRLDWDESSALWGNFNTGLTETEFSQYNRSLYGGQLDYRSLDITERGDPRLALKVFGSEAQTLSAHASFRATGGSLYYLPHRDIVQGSEKLWVEVRARDSEQVLDTEILLPGRDYEVDDIQGRILLARPLAMIVRERANTIIRSAPLDGDRVFLLADYEHVPQDFAAGEITSGARGKWSGERLSVGVTSVTDRRDGKNYELMGSDLAVHLGSRSFVKGELARSNAGQNDLNAFSLDGGLSFTDERIPNEEIEGDAYGLEIMVDLNDVQPEQAGELRAWHKNKDAEFSAGRLGDRSGYEDTGFSLDGRLSDRWSISTSAASLERDTGRDESSARVQTEAEIGDCGDNACLELGLEGRYERFQVADDAAASVPDGDAMLIGARVGREFRSGTAVYGVVQTTLDQSEHYPDNDQYTVGVNRRMTDRLAISLEGSDGDRGSALTGGIDYVAQNGAAVNLSGGIGSGATTQFGSRYSIAEGHELYGTYTMDPDRTDGARNQSTLGQRSQLGSRMNVFNETTFGRDAGYADTAHVFGLEFDATERWLLSADIQASSIETDAADIERRVFSIGASTRQPGWRLASRLEVRADKAQGLDTRQYLTSTRFGLGRMNDAGRWNGKLNLAWTDDRAGNSEAGRFIEFDIGYARRPIEDDRWNWLAKYSFLYDLGSNGQLGPNGRSDSQIEERSHVMSAEVLYDVGRGVELGAKLAGKMGEQRAFAEGQWYDTSVAFGALRARYRLPGSSEARYEGHWEALAEYRALRDLEDHSTRSGALLGVYRSFRNGQFKVGVGYNFTDFDGDLKRNDYRSGGWFLDVSAAY